MSIKIMTRVWEHSQSHSGALLLLLAIADFADDRGIAFPSVTTLAHKARLSERQVQYAMARLIRSGELTVTKQAGPKGCNLYRVMVVGGANTAPVQSLHPGAMGFTGGVQFSTTGGAIFAQGVQPAAPEPSLEPSIRTVKEPSEAARARAPARELDNELSSCIVCQSTGKRLDRLGLCLRCGGTNRG